MDKTEIAFPKSISVLGHTYQVELGEWEDLKDENEYGDCNYRLERIRVSSLRPASQQMEVFLHEILHLVSVKLMATALPEHDCSLLSEGLNQALQSAGVFFIGERAEAVCAEVKER